MEEVIRTELNPTVEDYNKLLGSYHKVVKSLREVENCLQVSHNMNAKLEAQLKGANNNSKFMIGGDPFPSYSSM